MRSFSVALALAGIAAALFAQEQSAPNKSPLPIEAKGMPPRATAADYPSQAAAGAITVAAEFMGHSVPRLEGPFSTEDYVVVEAGLFGPAGARLQLSDDAFSLRINGKKSLPAQPYGAVLSSLKDPSWAPPEEEAKSKTALSSGGSSGADSSPPPPVHMPIELVRSMAAYVQQAALPEGDRALPRAGLLFFEYRGKGKSIRSVELIYSGAAGKATLALHP